MTMLRRFEIYSLDPKAPADLVERMDMSMRHAQLGTQLKPLSSIVMRSVGATWNTPSAIRLVNCAQYTCCSRFAALLLWWGSIRDGLLTV